MRCMTMLLCWCKNLLSPKKPTLNDPGGGAQLETVHWLEGLGPPRDAGALHKSFAQQARAAWAPQCGRCCGCPGGRPCATAAVLTCARVLQTLGRAPMHSSARLLAACGGLAHSGALHARRSRAAVPAAVLAGADAGGAPQSGALLCMAEQGGSASPGVDLFPSPALQGLGRIRPCVGAL